MDRCQDEKSAVVVSSQGYQTSQEACAVQWVTETAGRDGPIYSAHMRCSPPEAPEQKMELDRIIIARADGRVSAGPGFGDLKDYQRCSAN
ncbi:MAG: hypothetical protein WBW74_00835 [Xanthobacteraceae bacterium]